MNQLTKNTKKNPAMQAILAKSRQQNVKNGTSPSSTLWDKSSNLKNTTSLSKSTSTNSFTESDLGSRVLGLSEGRGQAQCEVGIAFIDTTQPTLTLCQIADVFSYINTLTKINILNPTELIVPATMSDNDNRLIEKIRRQFPEIKIISVPRRVFNKANGMERILELCLPTKSSVCMGLQHRYFALASASALFTYLHNNLNIYYMTGTMNIVYQESEGFAIIDVSTADRLELVSCTKPAQATKNSTLFGILNKCYTRIGARALRSAILQPPFSKSLIEERLDCVTELMKHPQVLFQIQQNLQKITNIDQILSITSILLHNPDNSSTRPLNYLLFLNSLVDLIEPLLETLHTCRQSFFLEVVETLQNETFSIIKEKLNNLLLPTARPGKGYEAMYSRCFAIKPGQNGLLDLARCTYTERVEELKEYVKNLSAKYNLPLILNNNNTKGYHIVYKLNNQQKKMITRSELPNEFIQVCRLPGSFTMKTSHLINLSTRIEDILMQILKMSNIMIANTLKEISEHISTFYKLCEDIAKLDMYQSLAQVAMNNEYIRPKFREYTQVIQAKHPMLELLCSNNCIENSILISNDHNIYIITGPNSSGKSIYIRQVMLLQIMAQLGSYVPAKKAIFRPADIMIARVYLEGDIEWGASAFTLEISEIKYMLNMMTDHSLYILDEPCRSTCYEEGQALAMAICENFCKSSAYLLVCTHYTLLTKLADMYLNVKLGQMETLCTGDNPDIPKLKFTYRFIPGVTPLQLYALSLTRHLWPDFLYEKMWDVLQNVEQEKKDWNFECIDKRIKLKYDLESHFRKLKHRKKLTRSEIEKYVTQYQEQLQNYGEKFNDLTLNISSNLQSTTVQNATPTHNEPETDNANNFGNLVDYSNSESRQDFSHESNQSYDKFIPEISIHSSQREFIPNYSMERNFEQDQNFAANDMTTNIGDNRTSSSECRDFQQFDDYNMVDMPNNSYQSDRDIYIISDSGTQQQSCYGFDKQNEVFRSTPSNFVYQESSDHVFEGNSNNFVFQESSGPSSHTYGPSTSNFVIQESSGPSSHVFGHSTTNFALQESSNPSNQIIFNNTSSNSNCSQIIQSQSQNMFDQNQKTFECRSNDSEQSISYSPPMSPIIFQSTNQGDTSHNSQINFNDSNSNYIMFNHNNSNNSQSRPIYQPNESFKFPSSTSSGRPKWKKFTKRQILDEYREQDRKVFEMDVTDPQYSSYLNQMLNRPSVKQLQQTKKLAVLRKSDDGEVQVFPAPEAPPKRKRHIVREITAVSNIDVSMFSDENAQTFKAFLDSKEKDINRFEFK